MGSDFWPITGAYLVIIMGSKAIIAAAATALGIATYYLYGKKSYEMKESEEAITISRRVITKLCPLATFTNQP